MVHIMVVRGLKPLETRMKSSYVAEQAGFEPAEGY